MAGQADHGKNKTWGEMHELTHKQKVERETRAATKRKNRQQGMLGKVNWDVYQHDQLYDMIMSANPTAMRGRVDDWRALATGIESTTGEVQRIMTDLMGAWHGSAAVAAAASNTRLTQWAGNASHTADQVAAGMSEYTEAVAIAQRHMPEPKFASAENNFKDGYTVVGTGGPSTAVLLKALLSDQIATHEQASQAKSDAVRVMEDYESQSKGVHDTMPDFVPHTGGADPTPDPIRDGGGEPPPPPPPPPVPTDEDGTTTSQGVVDPSYGSGGYGSGGGGGTTSGYGGTAGFGSGGSGSGVAGGFGRGGAATGPLAARAPGGLVEGGVGGLGGARGVGGAAGAGTGGMYPPMGGAGANGEEDAEHTNRYDDGLDLFDDLPPAYPPVFGA